jgi:hypothetical protein
MPLWLPRSHGMPVATLVLSRKSINSSPQLDQLASKRKLIIMDSSCSADYQDQKGLKGTLSDKLGQNYHSCTVEFEC